MTKAISLWCASTFSSPAGKRFFSRTRLRRPPHTYLHTYIGPMGAYRLAAGKTTYSAHECGQALAVYIHTTDFYPKKEGAHNGRKAFLRVVEIADATPVSG
jgi:hypothetical protein